MQSYHLHMRHRAYLDKSADICMMFFSENGFPIAEFMRWRIGPVIMKDEVEYFKEVRLLDAFRVILSQAGMAEDGSRFLLRNELFRADGKCAARVTSAGGWLYLSNRKVVVPPDALLKAMLSLPKTEVFQVLESRIK